MPVTYTITVDDKHAQIIEDAFGKPGADMDIALQRELKKAAGQEIINREIALAQKENEEALEEAMRIRAQFLKDELDL